METNQYGINSLSGFAFQIKVFLFYLSKINENETLEFETLDDITYKSNSHPQVFLDEESELFSTVFKENSNITAIQVKKTKKTELTRVVANWLLLSIEYKINNFILFYDSINEEKISFDNFDINNFLDKMENNQKNSKLALFYKVKEEMKKDLNFVKDKLEYIIKNSKAERKKNLEEAIYNNFAKSFHRGGVSKETYSKRIESLANEITNDILQSIEKRKAYICDFNKLMAKSNLITSNISDTEYNPDFSSYKKTKIIDFNNEELTNSREFKQLKYCYANKLDQIEKHLLFNEYYLDYRLRLLDNNKENFIENIEITSYDNFCESKEYLFETNNDTPLLRLLKTKEKNNSYAQQNQIKQGSCIFLTSNLADIDKLISWKDENNED